MTHLLLKHGTCACNAKKIHQQGFNDYSYFTNNDELANYYAEVVMELCEHGCDDYEIITCRVPKKALTVDYNSYKEPLTYFRDEYADSDEEWFEMLETGEIHEPKDENDIETSLAVVWSVESIDPLPNDVIEG